MFRTITSMAKIVIVEDDQMLAEIYQTRMQLANHICRVAPDGLNALSLIREVAPDLVLLDLMLPQLSGDQVLAQMRNTEWGKDIKVIILTNISESEAPDGMRELGIERYIVKANISNNELDEIVAEVLSQEKTK
jgi:DNA-binding response OmpR family regulator